MKIYILKRYDRWEDTVDVIGYFTSQDKATEYMNALIDKFRCYEKKEFDTDVEELDPDFSWMKEFG